MKRFIALLAASAGLVCAAPASAAELFDYSGSIVSWIVPQTGTYQILGWGSQGGSGTGPATGGLGAEVGGDIQLISGEVLEIVVGGKGGSLSGDLGGGGGGGTWVFEQGAANPLLVAGGGGGSDWVNGPGGAGQATTSGQAGSDGSGAGGANGSGGKGSSSAGGGGGGGAGWLSSGGAGGAGSFANGSGGGGAGSFSGGATTGVLFPIEPPVDVTTGGFGGGGGGGYDGGGGGGGYSGGGGSFGAVGGAGGGGSYLSGGFTDTIGLSGVQAGNGALQITDVSPAPEPSEWAIFIAGLGLMAFVLRRRMALRPS